VVASVKVHKFPGSNASPCTSSFAAFLRRQHPKDTVYWVASKTGASASTVEAWLYEKSLPRMQHLGPLLTVYGPDVLAAIFPNKFWWLDEQQRDAKRAALLARRAEIDAEIQELCGE
jgi:hypothetical protein